MGAEFRRLLIDIAQRIPMSLPVAHRKQDRTSAQFRIYKVFPGVNTVFRISQAVEQFHL